jgi:hypothetical protein
MRTKLAVLVSLAAAVLAQTQTANASTEFPPVIADTLGITSQSACTICHATDLGGYGTVVKPFGIYMRSRGLKAHNADSLRGALAAMIAEKHDTDENGQTDEDALKAGADPNPPINPDVSEPIQYGCFRIATHRPESGLGWFAFGAAALLWLRRAQRRRG